jgi:hypothetical protein
MTEWLLNHYGAETLATMMTIALVLAWRWWTAPRPPRPDDLDPMSQDWLRDRHRHRLESH